MLMTRKGADIKVFEKTEEESALIELHL